MVAPAGGCETGEWQVQPNIFSSIKNEAFEELGLLPGEDYDAQVQLIGVARPHTDLFCVVFTYYSKTHLPFDAVKEHAQSIAPDKNEHQRLLSAPVDSSELLSFCSSYEGKMLGNGLGSLLAFGSHRYGESWLARVKEKLQEKNWDIVCPQGHFP